VAHSSGAAAQAAAAGTSAVRGFGTVDARDSFRPFLLGCVCLNPRQKVAAP